MHDVPQTRCSFVIALSDDSGIVTLIIIGVQRAFLIIYQAKEPRRGGVNRENVTRFSCRDNAVESSWSWIRIREFMIARAIALGIDSVFASISVSLPIKIAEPSSSGPSNHQSSPNYAGQMKRAVAVSLAEIEMSFVCPGTPRWSVIVSYVMRAVYSYNRGIITVWSPL